mgnify:CR=1 FL=1
MIKNEQELQARIASCVANLDKKFTGADGKRAIVICGGTGCLSSDSQAIIDELTAAIAEKDAQIADLQVKIEELTAELQKANEPVVEPVKMNKVAPTSVADKSNPALKYFQK